MTNSIIRCSISMHDISNNTWFWSAAVQILCRLNRFWFNRIDTLKPGSLSFYYRAHSSCLPAPNKGASPNGWSSSNLLCLPPISGQWRFRSWRGRGLSLPWRPMLSVVCPSDVFSRAVSWHGALVMCRAAGPVSRRDRTGKGDAW